MPPPPRSVPLSDLALHWLDGQVRYMDIPYIFVDAGRRQVWKHPRKPFTTGRAAADLDWVGLHDLRHFRATQWLMNGVDVNTVKALLGHANIQTTMRYVHYVETHATKPVVAAHQREKADWQPVSSGYKVDTPKAEGSGGTQ